MFKCNLIRFIIIAVLLVILVGMIYHYNDICYGIMKYFEL